MAETEFTFGASNLCVSPRDALTFKVGDYIDFLQLGGYDTDDGFEVTPTRMRRMMHAMVDLAFGADVSKFNPEEDDDSDRRASAVGSLQESWRENTVHDVLDHARRLDVRGAVGEAATIAAMPLLDKSYKWLRRLDTFARWNADMPSLPLIVHPSTQWLDNQAPRRPREGYKNALPSQEIWVQLTAEDAVRLPGVDRRAPVPVLAEQIIVANGERGVNKLVADLHHLFMERGGVSFGNEERARALFAELYRRNAIGEVQLAFRPDFGGKAGDLSNALAGRWDETPQGRALKDVKDIPVEGDAMRIVTEVKSSALADAMKVNGQKGNYVAGHARLIDGARWLVAA